MFIYYLYIIIYLGRYCTGSDKLKGKKCVVKYYNDDYVLDCNFWSREIDAHKKAYYLTCKWNNLGISKYQYRMLIPKQVLLGNNECVGEYCLVEEYLPNYQKWNSNTMTIPGQERYCVQAFSHWTYHFTNGKYLLCDCQGTFDEINGYTLTDPVIISCKKNSNNNDSTGFYGACDGGKDMMITWFQNHKCNKFCNPKWIKPKGISNVYIKPSKHTKYIQSYHHFYRKKINKHHSL